jgi:hypothetical protein
MVITMGFKNYGTKKKDELKYTVVEKIGVLDSDSPNPKELRVVAWGDNEPKYDVRSWIQNEDGSETPCKGITFDSEELYSLFEILQEMNEDDESEVE